MMNYEKITFKEFILKYKRHIIVFSALIFSLLTLYFLTPSSRKNTNFSSPTPAPTDSTIIDQGENNTSTVIANAYHINQIVTNKLPVTGLSWKGDKNIYSSSNGIYEAGTNTPVIEERIDKISWSGNFNALILSGDVWKKLDYKNKKAEVIDIPLKEPIINDSGTKIADFAKNILTVYNASDYTSSDIKFEEPIKKVVFTKTGNKIVVFTNYATVSCFYRLDENLKTEKVYNSSDNYILSSVSPSGELIALTMKNKLVIHDFSDIKGETTFLSKSDLISNFRDDSEMLVIEKYKDNLGITLDNIYSVSSSGKSSKISNSNPITNRVNFNFPISFNKNGYLASFIENGGRTWIISLKANLLPTYSAEGELVFSNIRPTSH